MVRESTGQPSDSHDGSPLLADPNIEAPNPYQSIAQPQMLHTMPSEAAQSDILAIDPACNPEVTVVTTSSATPTPERRQASWLSILVLPARVAVGALTFTVGTSLFPLPLRHPAALLTGCAATAMTQFLISVALSHVRNRVNEERARAECAQLERMHWMDAIQAVGKIVDRFKNGLGHPANIANIFIDVSLARLVHASTLARRLHIARTKPQTRADVLEAGRHYLDFALATYGYLLLRLTGIIHPAYEPLVEGSRGQDVARYVLQLDEQDFIVSHLDGEEINLPRHFVAFDHSRQSIVVAIRGTNSISDIITDLICANEPFENGYAHGGMKSAAEIICKSLIPSLRDLLAQYPRYSIVVTGHSMGAGVAILLTKLLLVNGLTDVKCYAFAPCPVFGPMHKVDTDWSDALECFVHADDLVATLCLSSARRLALEIERIDKKLTISGAEKRKIIKCERAEVIEDLLNRSRVADPDPREEEVDQLYLPCLRGVHWVIPAEGERNVNNISGDTGENILNLTAEQTEQRLAATNTRLKQQSHAEKRQVWKEKMKTLQGRIAPAYIPYEKFGSFIVRPRFFEKILVTPSCANSHFPNVYASAFAGLDLPPRDLPEPPMRSTNFTSTWYANEFG